MTDPKQKPLFNVPANWLAIINTIAVIILGVLVSTGKLTPQQADTVKTVIPLVVGDQQSQQTEQTPTPLQPQALQAPAAISPDQIKQWVELVKAILDALRPTPRPSPDITPQPGPQPQPQPDVTPPQPTALRIVITDELGRPVTGNTIESGRLIQVVAVGATGRVRFQKSINGPVSLIELQNNNGFTASLQSGGSVHFFVTDFGSGQQAEARIAANQAPQPPPNPNVDPVPVPDPDITPIPQPVGDRRAMILFDSASTTMTDDQRRVLGSMKLRDLLDARCVKQSDGTTGWRKWSIETDVTREQAPWPELFAQVKGQVQSVPSIALIRGRVIVLKPITDEASTLAFVEAWK